MSFFKSLFGDEGQQQKVSGMKWNALTDLGQLEVIVEESKQSPVVIFKHSTRCSISRMALKQFENEFDSENKIKPYFLDLLEYRAISNEIASLFDIMHQSPQMIVIKNGIVVHDASHGDIHVEDLKKI